jgi:ubiquinone/menaquinone biosynthesis C-methylase UbiE
MTSIWSDVDKTDDPSAAVKWQDTMATWTFCRQYKQRTIDLLQLAAGNCVLDLGCGPGADLPILIEKVGETGSVFGVDSSAAMISHAEEHVRCPNTTIDLRVADANDLPFQDDMFDACRADRVFQHLKDPQKALHELLRVTKIGGRMVVVDPDQDTLVIAVDAGKITEIIRDFRHRHLTNSTIAHKIGSMFADLEAKSINVEGHTMVLTDPADAFGLVEWPNMLHAQGKLTNEELSTWSMALQRSVDQGSFFYAVTFFITTAQKS